MPTSLYRIFDHHGRLLYVGITLNMTRRLGEHRQGKDWWHEVASIKVTHYPTRRAAERAERAAIESEEPRWNRAHAKPREHVHRPYCRPVTRPDGSLFACFFSAADVLSHLTPGDVK